MSRQRWDNEVRQRYIYLLAFNDRRVYVGSSIEPIRRIKAHRRSSSGWKEPFSPVVVDSCHGDQCGAVFREYAWRWAAYLNGWMPITSQGFPFELTAFKDPAKRYGEACIWPFSI